MLSTNIPNFDKMLNNPLCLQVKWNKNEKALKKWAEGKTGFPLIDAIMRQLRKEGWINHVQRLKTEKFFIHFFHSYYTVQLLV